MARKRAENREGSLGFPGMVKPVLTKDNNWKEAIIFPINKPGKDPHLASSYRPISHLSTIGKLTESIILHRLKNFINENNILNPNQYGFTNKLSTLHPLLRLTENISEGFQKKKSTGAVFLDIQKAFDRVWINGLTFKLITFKIPHPLIHLIHSYLTNRSFRIRINETLSNEHSVSAGCPQGSLLGPLLFNLYINDIPDYSLTKINLYADDTTIHATRFILGIWTVNSPQSHIVRVYDAGHGKSGVFNSAEWHDGDWSSDGIREAWLWFFIWVESF
ncbi:probable RNA-directed DNA polymerase from transposon X-element [Trichonephila clavipes]|nr:probable RNA-directed DNA polymerase from transposon X-element [Trichonephila clavipes]